MTKDKLSVIIPDRNGMPYLQRTIDGLLEHAEGEIEIIVNSDGTWPDPPLKSNPHVLQIYQGDHFNNLGMREGINRAIAVSTGEYIMKIDEHCMVEQGFDTKLKADCDDNWIVIPRRWRLDGDEWKLTTETINDRRLPVDYMQIDYPYQRQFDVTCGLHGAEWKRPEREHILIDDTPSMQGSCYFTKRAYWDKILPNGLNSEHYGPFTQEAQEISLTAWLSGGRVIVNKKTWYAHMHKGKKGKGYGFSNEQYKRHTEANERGRIYCINYWLSTQDFQYDWNWFINVKFKGMPGWEGNWRERIEKDQEFDFSRRRVNL